MPSSFLKSLDDYSRDNAITMLLFKDKHGSFDKLWKDWAADQRRLGETEVTVQELHGVMAEAIDRAPITDPQKAALFDLLHDELFQEHGLSATATLELPYSNVSPLKPGPELTALRAKVAADSKARATAATKAKAIAAAREKTNIAKAIKAYERVVKSLEAASNKSRAQVYRLEIAKLKRRLRD